MPAGLTDCVIVGGGPAGLTAALYLARFLRSVTVFDAQDGRARTIPKTHNLAAFPDGLAGQDMLGRMLRHAQHYGARVENATVVGIQREGDLFRVTTNHQTISARFVILATGVFNHRPPLPRADHDRGLAQGLIRYCPVCDAYEVRGQRVAVLGQGEHADREARFVRHYSRFVTLIPANGTAGVGQRGVTVLEAPMKRLSISESEVIVSLETGTAHRFDTLYVALGTSARADLATSLGVRLNASGHIVVDTQQKTSLDGVYAIGDVTDGLDQIAVAIGHAATAATAIHNSLSGMTYFDPSPAGSARRADQHPACRTDPQEEETPK